MNTNTVTIADNGRYPYVFFYTIHHNVGTTCGNIGLGLDKDEPELTLQDLRAVERFIADDLTGLGRVRKAHVVLTGYKRLGSLV